jgi:DNA-binding CsgD family transcriptional regulator
MRDMTVILCRETIYEAAYEDEVFAALPELIRRTCDARSVILHLVDDAGAHLSMAHTGHWSDDQVALYGGMADKDILALATAEPDRINQFWNITGDLVSSTRLYNSKIPGALEGWTLTVTPLAGLGGARALVVVKSLSDEHALVRRLQALFGLSQAEATVAEALSRGEALGEIAAARNVTEATVRSQLKSLFAKTGCRRQAQLVAMIASLPPIAL